MTTPHDARPVAQFRGTPVGPGISIPLDGAHIHLEDGECMDLYTATDYDALRSEVERLRLALSAANKMVGIKSADYRREMEGRLRATARAEAAEANGRELRSALDRLQHSYRLLLAGKPVRDVTETLAEVDAALTAQGDEGNG